MEERCTRYRRKSEETHAKTPSSLPLPTFTLSFLLLIPDNYPFNNLPSSAGNAPSAHAVGDRLH